MKCFVYSFVCLCIPGCTPTAFLRIHQKVKMDPHINLTFPTYQKSLCQQGTPTSKLSFLSRSTSWNLCSKLLCCEILILELRLHISLIPFFVLHSLKEYGLRAQPGDLLRVERSITSFQVWKLRNTLFWYLPRRW